MQTWQIYDSAVSLTGTERENLYQESKTGIKEWFTMDKMTELQQELLIKCLQHDLKWVRMLMHSYFHKWYGPILSVLYRFFVWLIERRAKKTGLLSSRTTIHRRMETAQINLKR